MSGSYFAGLPGLEPGKAGPESAVLPLHHSPKHFCGAKIVIFSHSQAFQIFFILFFSQKREKLHSNHQIQPTLNLKKIKQNNQINKNAKDLL